MGCTRGLVGSDQKGCGRNLVVLRLWDVDLVSLNLKKSAPFVGGSASPFIDEGDGSTGERERVRMSLSLAAHADEDWIIVGAPNTVDVAVEC